MYVSLDVIAWTAPRAIAAGALPNASRLEATVRWPHRHLRRVDDVYVQHINAHVCAAMDGCEGGMIGGGKRGEAYLQREHDTPPCPAGSSAPRPSLTEKPAVGVS